MDQRINSKLDEMLRKQSANFKAFKRTISYINLESISDKWELEDALKSLQARWSAIDLLHWEIESEITEENEQYENTFIEHEKQFNELKKNINIKMWSVAHRENSTPKMDIPYFNGNYHQWVSFKDLFNESIHSNKSISSAQKMQFLKSKLKGEAEKLIQHLNISSENYQICWDILNHRYNNTKLIFSTHINTLLSIPTMQQQSASQIKKIYDTINECLNAIKNLGIDISTWDPLIIHLLAQKLDVQTHNDYNESLKNPRDIPSLSEFLEFLENKFMSLESSRRKQDYQKTTDVPTFKKQQYNKPNFNNNFHQNGKDRSYANNFASKTYQGSQNCPLCKDSHRLFHCKTFLEYMPDMKRSIVNKFNLCKNCLHDHKGKICISEKRCRNCQGDHNTLLHDAFKSAPTDVNNDASTAASYDQSHRNNVTHVSNETITETLLATAQIKVLGANGTYHIMRALIDQGSQTSLISENAAQKLGLPRLPCKGSIYGIGTKEANCKGILKVIASAIYDDFTFHTDVLIMNCLTNNLPNQTFMKPSWPHLANLKLADPDFNISRPIDMLLGADVYSLIIMGGIIKQNNTVPVAQQTRLGWILCGNVQSFQCNVVMNNIEDIQQFWAIEDIAENSSNMSNENHQIIQQFQNETKRLANGRYVVKLPLRPEIKEKLGESKQKAVAQFHQLERKFSKNINVATDYKTFINEYIELGHMRECKPNTSLNYYLPHHCVIRTDSTTTALRVVFNASSKSTSGYSLNDLMFSGPNLQQDLFSLILRWRQYEYALTADIEKMFRQINCHEDDLQYQKIIWRDSPDQILREYELATVTYGTKAAPFLAMMTLKKLADDERSKYPEAAKVLEEDFYMDDLLSGSYSLPKTQSLQRDLTDLLKSGGFHLRKWSSNKQDLLEGVSKANNQEAYDFKNQESTKTLGLRWYSSKDQFKFQDKINTSSSKLATKRTLLSDISKIFDPLGWLSPLTIKLKILFQRVWLLNLQWDDKIPENINAEWSKMKHDLKEISHFYVERWLRCHENEKIELHGFCDSSTKAYACVIYCKITTNNTTSVVLVAGKTRLVPVNKNISLPRLELSAAYLLSKLMNSVRENLSNHDIQTFGWSDSTVVLSWLQGDPNRWKPFVANRVKHITNIMPAETWRYVKSADNPADCASRGLSVEQLKQHSLWWKGPEWLPTFNLSEEKDKISYTTHEEIKKTVQINITTKQCEDDVINNVLNKYSDITRATRVLAWISRALSRDSYKPPFLTINEIRKANHNLIKQVQQDNFADDISNLQSKGKVNSKSKLICLNPYIDQEGLLRVGGRINNAYISHNMKHPLIIPHSGHLTNLLIDHAHKMTFHGGARLTLAWLRQQVWIIGGNRAVKKRLRGCIICRRHNPIKQNQIMGDLPAARTNPTRPFYHTGVDYTGYVDVKANKGRGIKTTKGYIAVFVCMVTKAVHLELVSDLSSSSFLAALRRMSARRGAPGHVYSDNGTNFVGASRTLNQESMNLKKTLDSNFFTSITEMQIQWHFNAPSWPSAGGLWEAAVKSLKYHIKRVIGEQKLTYEEFATLLSQLEACLNSRPLCALSEDPDDTNYLTPSHFLASGPILTIIETEQDQRTRWQMTQKIFDDIWKRWRAEYLCQLSSRSKWHMPQPNLQVNDIVIIHDANLPPGKWALGRITELHPGKDGYVRVVTVKTKNGMIKRPITKLSLLPVTEQQTNKHS